MSTRERIEVAQFTLLIVGLTAARWWLRGVAESATGKLGGVAAGRAGSCGEGGSGSGELRGDPGKFLGE